MHALPPRCPLPLYPQELWLKDLTKMIIIVDERFREGMARIKCRGSVSSASRPVL